MPPSIRRLPRALAVLYAGTIVTRIGTFVVPYLTVYLATERGLSLTHTGEVVAAGGLGLLLGNLVGGATADAISRRFTLLAAIVVNVVGVALLSLSLPSATTYALALGVALCGAGMYTPAANALIADVAPSDVRPLAYTVNYVCINVGMGMGPLLGGVLAASSFRWLFIGDIVASLGCAALLAIGLPRRRRGTRAPGKGGRRTALWRVWAANPAVTLFAAASIVVVAPLMGLEYTVPLLVGRVWQRPLFWVGIVYTVNAACILGLSFFIERALRGRDEVAMMAVAAVLWTAGLLILALGFTPAALIGCTVVWTVGEIIASIVVPSYVAARVAATAKARMLALQDVVRSLSAVAAPVVLGLSWDHVGVDAVLAILVGVPASGVVAYGGAWLVRRRAGGSSAA